MNKVTNTLSLKKKHLIPCVYHFYKNPMVLEKGKGLYLTDSDGKKYMDAYSGVGVVNCGHCNPSIVARTVHQVKKLQHTTTIYLTEPMMYLAKKLSQFVGSGMKRSFFCTSGSEANEGAMLLARLHTGKKEFISFKNSLHGRTHLTSSATGMDFWRTDPYPSSGIHFVEPPVCSDCPLNLKHPSCRLKCLNAVEDTLKKRKGRIAAMLVEIIQGNGGIQVPPPDYFKKLRALLHKNGALLIIDEAQSGFCRTGKRFAFKHYGIEPDILTVCKALGNGLPIAAFMTTDQIAASYKRPGASTFGSNPVTCETALATLDFLQSNKLENNTALIGRFMKKSFETFIDKFGIISEVRGIGLMIGIQIKGKNAAESASLTDELLETLKSEGVLAGKTGSGRNVLTFMPPLIITKNQAIKIIQSTKEAFCRLSQKRSVR